jgi:hypothetical protein
MGRQHHLATKEARLAVSNAIRDFLHATGQPRKLLVGREPHKLSESTVNKIFQGEFSERTLTVIETILGRTFRLNEGRNDKAANEVGGYVFDTVDSLQGDYFCVRPVFNNPTQLTAYVINISWNKTLQKLVIEEHSRADAQYTQKGEVYLPFQKPFMNLVSGHLGSIRTIMLSLPSDGLCRGIISTLSNPRGAIYIPVSAPIFLQRFNSNDLPQLQLGLITVDSPMYSSYQDTLGSVMTEAFGLFVMNQNHAERRRGMSVVND